MKDTRIELRLSRAEKEAATAAAGEVSLATWIRGAMEMRLKPKPVVREVNPFGAVPAQIEAWTAHALTQRGQSLGEWACDMLDRCMEKQKNLEALGK